MLSHTPITTIAFDGDDTLWHHDSYFNEAKAQFHSILNELGPYPDAGDRAMNQHTSDLPLWGYGVKSFTLSMAEAAIAMTDGQISGKDIKRILDIGRSLYQHPVILLDHVAETIQALQGRYRLVLITKGDLFAQEMKIAQSKLAPFFDQTEIVSEKDIPTYRRLCQRHQIDPASLVMIGNSLKSDVLPPLAIGAQAVYIPYKTTPSFELAEIVEEQRDHYITLPTMKDVSDILAHAEQAGETLLSKILQPAAASA